MPQTKPQLDMLSIDLAVKDIVIGFVDAVVRHVPILHPAIEAEITTIAEMGNIHDEERRQMVRAMLRYGSYRPTGRGKPASEYLLNVLQDGRFPKINLLVDIVNLASVKSLLPISLIDVDKAGTCEFLIRRGRKGESYIFNPSGQVIDLEDLLLVASLPSDTPCGSAVKDSQATKTDENTRRCLAVIYCPKVLRDLAGIVASEIETRFMKYANAITSSGVLSPI